MRLINVHTLELEEYYNDIPEYAILSHTWGTDEVSFADWKDPESARRKKGFQKIKHTCRQARRHGIAHVWVDTNCIDKSSSAELTEAINSMFQWYQNARVCYVHLQDLSVAGYEDLRKELSEKSKARPTQKYLQLKEHASDPRMTSTRESGYLHIPDIRKRLEKCKWFTRGWTLQELLAPETVLFYSREWEYIGMKNSDSRLISTITGIDEHFITNPSSIHSAPICKRMAWVGSRKTTRVEDLAYCLLGLFQINMPLLYGEGRRAFQRLQEEIIRVSNDQTIFCWGRDCDLSDTDAEYIKGWQGMLAPFPAAFSKSSRFHVGSWAQPSRRVPRIPCIYTVTNAGLDVTLPVMYAGQFICVVLDAVAPIENTYPGIYDTEVCQVILVLRRDESGTYVRTHQDPVITKLPNTLKLSRARLFIACSGMIGGPYFDEVARTVFREQPREVDLDIQLLLVFDHYVIYDDPEPTTGILAIRPVPDDSVTQSVVSGTCIMSNASNLSKGDNDYPSRRFHIYVRAQHQNDSKSYRREETPFASPIDVDIYCVDDLAAFAIGKVSAFDLDRGRVPGLGARIEPKVWRIFPGNNALGSNLVMCFVKFLQLS